MSSLLIAEASGEFIQSIHLFGRQIGLYLLVQTVDEFTPPLAAFAGFESDGFPVFVQYRLQFGGLLGCRFDNPEQLLPEPSIASQVAHAFQLLSDQRPVGKKPDTEPCGQQA